MDQREILEKLARGEISRQEADRLLGEQPPPPAELPATPPKRSSGLGIAIGCIVAAAIGLLLLFLLVGGLFCARATQVRAVHQEQRLLIEQQQQAFEQQRQAIQQQQEAIRQQIDAEQQGEHIIIIPAPSTGTTTP